MDLCPLRATPAKETPGITYSQIMVLRPIFKILLGYGRLDDYIIIAAVVFCNLVALQLHLSELFFGYQLFYSYFSETGL